MQRSHLARPPYVDPTTNIIYDTDSPEYEGWLTKQSVWLKDWRRRYFLLKGSKLFFGKNEYSPPHGMIDLAHCTTVKSADLKSKKRHSFEISTPEVTFLMYADTEKEKDDWIGRVGKAIVRCSSTFYSSNNNNNNGASGGGAPGQGSNPQRGYAQSGVGSPYAQQMGYPPQEDESDDDDILYEDPNNPNPYFND
eukprot:Nitzschia sp. Nitz4//scaffold77_size91520//22100//22863//NITZ4_004882-RA/size91520-processed-gene-0.26-mRNA-1//1//CDS//3329557967//4488//frame0